MPNRSRSGEVSRPARVVAPISVKGGRSSLIERAAGPSPIMMSSWKSSSAGYRISSTTGARRWISSMKSTSFGSRLVRIAARSPGRSSTGPEVWRRFTPSSRAMMCASVVLPSPGGPNSSTWSSASPRPRAAAMKISSCERTFSWPTYSASVAGLSERSNSFSCGEAGRAEIMRSGSTLIGGPITGLKACPRFCQSARTPGRRPPPGGNWSEPEEYPDAQDVNVVLGDRAGGNVVIALPFRAHAELSERVLHAGAEGETRAGLRFMQGPEAGPLLIHGGSDAMCAEPEQQRQPGRDGNGEERAQVKRLLRLDGEASGRTRPGCCAEIGEPELKREILVELIAAEGAPGRIVVVARNTSDDGFTYILELRITDRCTGIKPGIWLRRHRTCRHRRQQAQTD